MTKNTDAFDHYVDDKLKSPSFAEGYEQARAAIDTTDQLVRALDAQRAQLRLTKAQLARRAGMEPAALRRLFTREASNPTFSTIVALLHQLNLRLVVVRNPAAKNQPASRSAKRARRSEAKRPARSARP